MKDLHCHIIYGVDDGSRNIDESMELLRNAHKQGMTDMIFTPHYMEETDYVCNNEDKLNIFNTIKDKMNEENIPINIYLGNEVFFTKEFLKLLAKDEILTLNNSKYLLFELPFHNQIIGLADIVYEMKVAGYIPILAHPERYSYFQKNPHLLDELKKEGLLFQCNYASILGNYGIASKKLLKYLLKKEYVDYFGTDIHHINKTFVTDNFDKIKKHIIKITGEEYFQEIINNCDNLVK